MANQHDWLIQPFAHRGLHAPDLGIIENTSSAFQAALNAGYGIELDVRTAGDGEVIVFHDATLNRLTTATGKISAHTTGQLRMVTFRNSGDRIQTLAELLEQVNGRVPLLIEIKTDWINHGPCERGVAACLESYNGPAAVMSFDPNSVAVFALEFPGITRGIIADRYKHTHSRQGLSWWQRFYMRHLLSAFIAKPHFVNYDVRALPSLAPLIWKHVMHRPLLTWTVRSSEQALHARRWADDIVFENFQP